MRTWGERRAWAIRAVMALALACAGVTSASAQESDKAERQIGGEVKDPTKLGGEKPTLAGDESDPSKVSALDNFKANKKFDSQRKLDEQIVQIKRLIKITPNGHPDRPDFLFNLAELYWEKSKYYNNQAYFKQDECYKLKDSGDEKKTKGCFRTMKAMLEEAKRQRVATIELYIEIINGTPTYPRMDEVLYYLGSNLMEIGKRVDALDIYRKLVANHPSSRFVPNVLVAFGDYYFDADEMGQALKAYDKVTDSYSGSAVYGYATYKKGWCYFNMDDKKKALQLFLATLQFAKENKKLPNARPLLRQSRKDIVMVYSHVGTPSKAIPFFKKVADDDREEWLAMGERLAVYYSDKGKFNNAIAMYKELIGLNKKSIKVLDYQAEVVRNQSAKNAYSKESLEEIVRLARVVKAADDGQFSDRDEEKFRYKEKRAGVEELARNWALTFHREAQQTRNPDLYAKSYFIYKHYLDAFPDSKDLYMMTFFYGELLYKVQKWQEAADAYEDALKVDPKGKYTEEIVHSTVLAYDKLIEIKESKNKNLGGETVKDAYVATDDKDKKKKESGVPEKKEIPELHQRFVNACERYAKYAPDGERIVDVKYAMARIYYEHAHFEEAAAAFKDIAFSHRKHRLASVSANLHLSCLEFAQKYDELEGAVAEYLDKKPIKDEVFLEDLTAMYSAIRFKKCTIFDEKENWKNGATCFVSFAKDFPESEYVDKALYNAALDFEKMSEIGLAISARYTLLKTRGNSELAPITLYNLAANYHALAVYSRAAKFYELFVKNFPEHEKAEDALANASTFRQGLGEYDRAIAAYEKYIELYGRKKRDKAAEVYFQIAKIYDIQNKKKDAYNQYKSYLKKWAKYGKDDRRLEAQLQIGLYFWNRAGSRNRRDALRELEKTVGMYKKMSQDRQEKLTTGRDAAAQALFLIGEDIFEEASKMKIDSRDDKQLKKRVEARIAKVAEAQATFENVIKLKRPDWAIAALFRIGDGMEKFANELRASKCPKGIGYDVCEIYKGLLEDRATTIENSSVTYYELALKTSKDKSWFNDFTKEAEARLAKLRPRQYRTPSELRAEPNHVQGGMDRVAFIKDIKDEDRMDDVLSGDDDEGAEGAQ